VALKRAPVGAAHREGGSLIRQQPTEKILADRDNYKFCWLEVNVNVVMLPASGAFMKELGQD
jgi:hypothetical protein